jgi:hypothetical protein
MGALDRRGTALHDIYHDSYCSSSKDAAKSPRSDSPRASAHGRAAAAGAGAKEHATAAQIWQHVKEACAETASDVAHMFRSRSGGSLHQTIRSDTHSPERLTQQQQQQQQQPVSPPSPRTLFAQPGTDVAVAHQQSMEQPLLASGERAAGSASKASSTAASTAAGAGAAAAAGVGHTGSSSNLVRLGSRGSIPAVSLAEMASSGSSSSSKPPRYQPACTASREQLLKQPLSPPRQLLAQQQQQQLEAQQQQQVVAIELQVPLKQQLLSQQQEEVQLELEAMRQQEGISGKEVKEAAVAVATLTAAAEAVAQAAAAGGGGCDSAHSAPTCPQAFGSKPAASMQGADHSNGASAFANPHQLWSDVRPQARTTDSNSLLPAAAAAPGLGLMDLGSRELSFAHGSAINCSSSGGGSNMTAATAAAADRLSSHALDSPDKQQQQQGELEGQQGLAGEYSVTFPKVAGCSSVEQPALQQQQQQQQKADAAAAPRAATAAHSPAASAADASEAATSPTLLNLRSIASTSDEQLRGRPMLTSADAAAAADGASTPGRRQQQGQRTGVSAESRSAHTSASPSRRHKGRFTIIET